MKDSESHGWKAVGTEKTIPKNDGTQVFTIENAPPVMWWKSNIEFSDEFIL